MTLNQLRELVEKSKKETERQWGNKEGLQFTNELLSELQMFIDKGYNDNTRSVFNEIEVSKDVKNKKPKEWLNKYSS